MRNSEKYEQARYQGGALQAGKPKGTAAAMSKVKKSISFENTYTFAAGAAFAALVHKFPNEITDTAVFLLQRLYPSGAANLLIPLPYFTLTFCFVLLLLIYSLVLNSALSDVHLTKKIVFIFLAYMWPFVPCLSMLPTIFLYYGLNDSPESINIFWFAAAYIFFGAIIKSLIDAALNMIEAEFPD